MKERGKKRKTIMISHTTSKGIGKGESYLVKQAAVNG
jgi:hypothetical protein